VLNSNTLLPMYLFCNSRIHVITLYSGHVCVYYASMLQCWHLVWILVRTDYPYLGVGCHTQVRFLSRADWSVDLQFLLAGQARRSTSPSAVSSVFCSDLGASPGRSTWLQLCSKARPFHASG
jgi:hypothetical protein